MKWSTSIAGMCSAAKSKLEGGESHPAWSILDGIVQEAREWQETVEQEQRSPDMEQLRARLTEFEAGVIAHVNMSTTRAMDSHWEDMTAVVDRLRQAVLLAARPAEEESV